jgi:glycosyltransferase involved in cell wall biosynthesis
MILLIHRDGLLLEKALKDNNSLSLKYKDPVKGIFDLARKYPNELLLWVDVEFCDNINWTSLIEIFDRKQVMASFAIRSRSIPPEIGYIDQLPFVNPKYSVRYPTWMMSTDIGGIHASALNSFEVYENFAFSFDYFLNSIAKIGQQNSLLCYSDPNLTNLPQGNLTYRFSAKSLFNFVGRHYKKEWLIVLFYCYYRFDNKIPIGPLINSYFSKTFFKRDLSLAEFEPSSNNGNAKSIDVIIPTLNRREHLRNVLIDLNNQKLKPKNVIIVEQGMDEKACSELDFLNDEWDFNIIHHFLKDKGACKARNWALEQIGSDIIFFADDDIRFEENLLNNAFSQLKAIKVGCLNLNAQQENEDLVFNKIKQWGAFASGASLVKSEFLKNCRFDRNLEKGFGEDIDFGMQLRQEGCDIVYHPYLKLKHLKASSGGFRNLMTTKVENQGMDKIPKPAPTMMILMKKWYSRQMLDGYRIALNLKFYRYQPVKNPLKYLKSMKKRWRLSEALSKV